MFDYLFWWACEGSSLPLFRLLSAITPDKLRTRIRHDNYSAFRRAAAFGCLEVLQELEQSASDELQAMIQADNYAAFRDAAANGDLKILYYLEQKAPDKLQTMIQAYNYAAFRHAAANGHLEILYYLEQKAPDKLQAMIEANEKAELEKGGGVRYAFSQIECQKRNYAAFRHAAKNGHLKILHYLEQKAPDKLQAMIQAKDFSYGHAYAAFCLAAANGHLDILHYLEEKAPDKLQAMIGGNSYSHKYLYIAFCFAAAYGHLNILHYLEQKAPDKLQAMIQANNYEAFREAAKLGELKVLKYLEQKAPDKLEAMIQATIEKPVDYLGYPLSYRHLTTGITDSQNLDTLKYLEQKAPHKFQAILQYDNHRAFRYSANSNHQRTALSKLFLRLISSNGYNYYQSRETAAAYFLNFSSVFGYAESHEHEYSSYILPLVDAHLTNLQSQKIEFEQRNPNALFDITAEQAHKSFYCLRNLIRRNNPIYRDNILFLINIPAVKALLHTEVTANQPNELLLLAMNLRNQEAVNLLLDVPAVRQLARENNYYQAEVRNGIDAARLALDRESSMRGLTLGEQKRIDTAHKHYQPVIQQKGVAALMNELRKKLEARYVQNPAFIMLTSDTGKPIRQILPLKREDFDLLPLSDAQKKEALQAYYQHQEHGALRYLSKPNPWMHEQADYVNMNPLDNTQKWSTFDEYEPLIALLYVAAVDENTPATDGYTIETRFERFIAELAQINRAHNWDRSRDKGKGKEEYDDMEGDRPSCYSGVKRRLFQSLLGHPLFILFTADNLKSELRDFARNHFKQVITGQNRSQLKKAWNDVCDGNELNEEQTQLFKSLNINSKQQEQFVDLLTRKYGEQFSSDASFQTLINLTFNIKENHLCSSAFASTKWWDFLEPQAEFLELLRALEKKKEEYLVSYPQANEQAKTIIRELTQKANTFYQIHSPTTAQLKQFKSDCLNVIHQNSSALEEHRIVLGAFFAALRHFFSDLTNIFLNKSSRYGFFESKTESAKIIEEIEQGIERLTLG